MKHTLAAAAIAAFLIPTAVSATPVSILNFSATTSPSTTGQGLVDGEYRIAGKVDDKSVFGSVYDPNQELIWLDWSETVGKSELSALDDFDDFGFRLASESEVSTLLSNHFGVNVGIDIDAGIKGIDFVDLGVDTLNENGILTSPLASDFVRLFGETTGDVEVAAGLNVALQGLLNIERDPSVSLSAVLAAATQTGVNIDLSNFQATTNLATGAALGLANKAGLSELGALVDTGLLDKADLVNTLDGTNGLTLPAKQLLKDKLAFVDVTSTAAKSKVGNLIEDTLAKLLEDGDILLSKTEAINAGLIEEVKQSNVIVNVLGSILGTTAKLVELITPQKNTIDENNLVSQLVGYIQGTGLQSLQLTNLLNILTPHEKGLFLSTLTSKLNTEQLVDLVLLKGETVNNLLAELLASLPLAEKQDLISGLIAKLDGDGLAALLTQIKQADEDFYAAFLTQLLQKLHADHSAQLDLTALLNLDAQIQNDLLTGTLAFFGTDDGKLFQNKDFVSVFESPIFNLLGSNSSLSLLGGKLANFNGNAQLLLSDAQQFIGTALVKNSVRDVSAPAGMALLAFCAAVVAGRRRASK